MKLVVRNKLQKMVMAGVMAALLAVLSQVSVPMPTGVPVTLQTFAVALCGYVLGPGLGTLSVGVYLVMGAVGLPVLAQFSGGIGFFFSYTGGFLWGFLPMALLCGLGMEQKSKPAALAPGLAGLAACHLCSVLEYALVSQVSPWQGFLLVSAPYLIKDVVSLAAALAAAFAVVLGLRRARLVSVE